MTGLLRPIRSGVHVHPDDAVHVALQPPTVQVIAMPPPARTMSSHMLCTADDLTSYLCPINTAIKLLIYQTANNHIIASHQIQAGMWLLCRRLFIIWWPNDAFNRVFQHKIRDLIAANERAGECAAVNGNDENFLCQDTASLALPHVCKPDRKSRQILVALTVEIWRERHPRPKMDCGEKGVCRDFVAKINVPSCLNARLGQLKKAMLWNSEKQIRRFQLQSAI